MILTFRQDGPQERSCGPFPFHPGSGARVRRYQYHIRWAQGPIGGPKCTSAGGNLPQLCSAALWIRVKGFWPRNVMGHPCLVPHERGTAAVPSRQSVSASAAAITGRFNATPTAS